MLGEFDHRLQRQVGVYGLGAVACQQGEVVGLSRRARLHNQTSVATLASFHQMLVDSRQGQQRRHGHAGLAHFAVGHDEDVVAALDRVYRFSAQGGDFGLDAFAAPGSGVGDVERIAFELAARMRRNVAQLGHVGKVQHRLAHFQAQRWVDGVDVQQIGLGADEGHQGHDDLLADRVNRRIGHLGEELLEVVVQRLVFV